MEYSKFQEKWSELHGQAEITKVISIWLHFAYFLATKVFRGKPVANYLTSFTAIFAIGYLFFNHNWLGLLFMVISLMLDGLDGPLAIFTESESIWGGFYDSFTDRIVESLWFYGFYLASGKLNWVGGMLATYWIFALTQEYLRARAGGLGSTDIGIVTISERPVRGIFLIILEALALTISFHSRVNREIISYILAVALLFQIIALAQLVKYYKNNFSGPTL
jgi:phosphatidylglycerophosphate synthase